MLQGSNTRRLRGWHERTLVYLAHLPLFLVVPSCVDGLQAAIFQVLRSDWRITLVAMADESHVSLDV